MLEQSRKGILRKLATAIDNERLFAVIATNVFVSAGPSELIAICNKRAVLNSYDLSIIKALRL